MRKGGEGGGGGGRDEIITTENSCGFTPEALL